jgi:hypothetical protein
MWAMMPMLRMFSLWLMRRSISVVCLNRGMNCGSLCLGSISMCVEKFFLV